MPTRSNLDVVKKQKKKKKCCQKSSSNITRVEYNIEYDNMAGKLHLLEQV